MSDSVQPHRRQPIRLPCPWDSPGKNTGVGCDFLLQCMKVKSESEVVQLCRTLSDPMDCRLPGSSVHGIFQARVLEWGAIAFSEWYAGKCLISDSMGEKKALMCGFCQFSWCKCLHDGWFQAVCIMLWNEDLGRDAVNQLSPAAHP